MPLTRPFSLALIAAGLAVACNKPLPSGPARVRATPEPLVAGALVPLPVARGCGLPRGQGSGLDCPRQAPSFLPQVESAMDQIVAEEPHLFDLDKRTGCGKCYLVRDTQRFEARMVQVLESKGLCAIYDGEELGVKNSNAFNDQYDILTSELFIRRELGSYRSTCYPAWF